MSRPELSTTLKNLKFMLRASPREVKTNIDDQPNFPAASTITRKCMVVMEGDPHPGALKGRMSFQNFNAALDKLNVEEARFNQPAAEPETTFSRNQSGNVSFRESSSTVEGRECCNLVNGNAKRKSEQAQYPSKSPKKDQGNRQSSPSLNSCKKPRGDKIGWNVLRSSKCQTK